MAAIDKRIAAEISWAKPTTGEPAPNPAATNSSDSLRSSPSGNASRSYSVRPGGIISRR
jgi:hypothetical protein